ncbi:cytosine deaminase [Actinorhabdospora filicis]|uniref:Cytosine deaminase n=1 Tax=Actinorhabdospora filicis TaxID=1785913 RepID=A0A9W6SPR4_9ACTN|nr:amidohydrolase [Actinorhabdospora filicis]GLZ79872.1 cytosine deaminase [Actinorhabdospora filicis]
MSDLLLRNAVLGSGAPTDVLISGGRIAATGAGLTAPAVEELGGALVLPGFIDGHAHLDKTLWGGPWVPHTAPAGLAAKIHNGRVRRPELGIPSADYVTALLTHMVTLGTTHVRSHVDVDPDVGLGSVHAVREALSRLDGRITAELVAFPQTGMLISPGTEALLEEALKAGVEHIGGIDPAGVDRDPVRHLDIVFALAGKYGVGVDVHLHDRGTLGVFQYDLIIERTRALGLSGRVTISHGYALAGADPATRERLIAALAENGISLASTGPAESLPIRDLAAAGVPVTLGNDGIRDLWSPYGTGDMLERALFQAKNAGFARDEEIQLAVDAVTYWGASVAGLPDYGLTVGSVADLVVVPARNAAEAVMVRPVRDLVVKGGRIVARRGELV